MATLVLVSGGRRHPIAKADIDKHPDSLLQSLMASTAAAGGDDDEVTLDLDRPGFDASPFRAWPAAAGITAELFSQGHACAATLSEQLRHATCAELLTKLRELLDYLALPGPLCKWLPARSSIPLRHTGVRDLHLQAASAAAAAAVETMLDAAMAAAVIHDNGRVQTARAAAFCFCAPGLVPDNLDVYLLSSPHELVIERHGQHGNELSWREDGTVLVPLPVRASNPSRYWLDQVADECGEVVDQRQPLVFAALSQALQRQVSKIPIDGRTGGLQCEFAQGSCGSSVELPMWVVYHET